MKKSIIFTAIVAVLAIAIYQVGFKKSPSDNLTNTVTLVPSNPNAPSEMKEAKIVMLDKNGKATGEIKTVNVEVAKPVQNETNDTKRKSFIPEIKPVKE